MATGSSNPTVRRRELARRLRELRLTAGRSVDEVAKELMCSAAKVSRLETGERGVQQRDIRDLCRFYGVSDAERDYLMKLAQEAAKRGWWQDFGSLDQQVATFVALESAAKEIRFAQGMILPGLLQTAEFTRELLPHLRSPGEMNATRVEEAVRLRERRQQRLLNGDVRFTTVVDQAAFARVVGSAGVMWRQLDWLIELCDLPSVSIQVVPFGVGPHPVLEGSFQYLSLGAPGEDEMVFVEGLLGAFLIDDREQVRRYCEIFHFLSQDVALSVDDSLEWIHKERVKWAV